jgi:hypothetical protein
VLGTFQEAAERLGLRRSEEHWHKVIKEYDEEGMFPAQLRGLLANILMCCQVSNALNLWEAHKEALSEDEQHKLRDGTRRALSAEELQSCYDRALLHLDDILRANGKSLDAYGLPQPALPAAAPAALPQVIREQLFTVEEQARLKAKVEDGYSRLNHEQKLVFDVVWASIEDSRRGNAAARTFFVDAPGGTGKTFIFNLLLAKVRSEGRIALAVSSSGVAALLLQRGSTAHSRFKVPIDLTSTSTCYFEAGSDVHQLIDLADLIVWDEAPMMHRHSYEALYRTLRKHMGSDLIMAGKVFLLGGDFRQVLPVVHHGDRTAIVQATLRRSEL